MAKSIWKRGERMTRLEKKKLRSMIPHPNHGRRLYQWKVENARITRLVGDLNGDGCKVDWAAIADKPTIVAPGIRDDSVADDDCAGDENYALPAYAKDDGPLTQEQLDWLYKNTVARPGEAITEMQMEQLRKSILSSTERLDLPPNTDLSELYVKSDPEEPYLEMVIGVFGVRNRNGEIYKIEKAELIKRLDMLVGNPVGEIGQNKFSDKYDIDRTTKIDPSFSAGKLLSYSIEEDADGSVLVYMEKYSLTQLCWMRCLFLRNKVPLVSEHCVLMKKVR